MTYSTRNATASALRRCLATFVLCMLPAFPKVAQADLAKAEVSKAEFSGACAMGLAEGKLIKTNCAVSWTAGDGKVYCFNSEASKAAFLKDPDGNIQRARETFSAGTFKNAGDAMAHLSADDARSFIEQHIAALTAKTGLFELPDPRTNQTLALKFKNVDFVRTLHGYGFFPNVNFHAADDETKRYQIDFWLQPKDGKLHVVDTRIYKAPRREGDQWVMMTRQPKPWWWIPASEHPGESESKRGWEVMGALHNHIAQHSASGGGKYILKDDKTGQELSLDFVGIHQPVRRLKEDGRFFACTDFRKSGSADEFYDIDFWMDEKNGQITVGGVRVHKVPTLEDGNFVQIPRYSFDPKTFDVVP